MSTRLDEPITPAGLENFKFAIASCQDTPIEAERIVGCSSRLLLLQPHPDDVALSLGGFLSGWRGSVSIESIFCQSDTSEQRMKEDRRFVATLGGNLRERMYREGEPLPRFDVPEVCAVGCLALAPMAISRHRDHIAVRDAALQAGVQLYWEDVAFWGIYGMSTDDRVMASMRDGELFAKCVALHLDITEQWRAKARFLSSYTSQSRETWRPLRYAWTVGAEIGQKGRLFERIFVMTDHFTSACRFLGLQVRSQGVLRYGTATLSSFTGTWI